MQRTQYIRPLIKSIKNLFIRPHLGVTGISYSLTMLFDSDITSKIFSTVATKADSATKKMKIKMSLPDGNKIKYRISDMFVVGEVYIGNVYKDVEDPSFDTVIDVGANIGLFSLKQSKIQSKETKFICIEADPENFEILSDNIKSNHANIVATHAAAASKPGKIEFFVNPIKGHSSLQRNEGGRKVEINAITLDEETQEMDIGRTLLKIDVEGAEIDVLKGSTNLLSQDVTLIMEVHKDIVDLQDVTSILSDFGYTTTVIEDTRITCTILSRKSSEV